MKTFIDAYRTKSGAVYSLYETIETNAILVEIETSSGEVCRSLRIPTRKVETHHPKTAWFAWLCYEDRGLPPALSPLDILDYFLTTGTMGVIQEASSEESEESLAKTYLDFSKRAEYCEFDIYGTMVPGAELEFKGLYQNGLKRHEAYTSWLASRPGCLNDVLSVEAFLLTLRELQETDPTFELVTTRAKNHLKAVFEWDILFLLNALESGVLAHGLNPIESRFLYNFICGLPFEFTYANLLAEYQLAA